MEIMESVSQRQNYYENVQVFLDDKIGYSVNSNDETVPENRRNRYGELIQTVRYNGISPRLSIYQEEIRRDGWKSLTKNEINEYASLCNISMVIMACMTNLEITFKDAKSIDTMLNAKKVSQKEFFLIIEFYQKIENLYQALLKYGFAQEQIRGEIE